MSAAESELEDNDPQLDPTGDTLQDFQAEDEDPSYSPEEVRGSIAADEPLFEPSASHQANTQPITQISKDPPTSRAPLARVVPAIANNPFASEPTYFIRPNRYFGPDSTWLSWTKEERLIAETLDRLRSQDLSIHLFNVHALNKKGERTLKQNRDRRKGKGRAKSVEEEEESDHEGGPSFVHPRTWTAWPLRPDQVPREREVSLADGHDTYHKAPDPRPSAVLEDCIMAATTGFARERWRARIWETTLMEKRDMKVEHNEEDAIMREAQHDLSPEESEAAGTLSTESESELGSPLGGFQHPNSGHELGASNAAPVTDQSDGSPVPERRPIPIVDDESARSLLLPGTRHIISKLDDLLIGLHTARQAYATAKPRANKKSKGSHDDGSDSAGSDQSRSVSGGRKRKRSVSVASTTSDRSKTSIESQGRHSRSRQLGLRDWSDVVGMAALTGWSPAVVQRASERCATLFGENMLFRTFFEGNALTNQQSYFTEHYAVSEASISSPETESRSSPEKSDGPIAIRTSKACTTCQALNDRCEPANAANPGTGPCKRCIANNTACSGITGHPVSTSIDKGKLCPFSTCDRHTIPFAKPYHLQRHLNTVHRNDASPSSPSPSSTPRGEYLPSSDIVCPVLSCPRHERGFAKGARLYAHIVNMHPEVDVEEVKRLESRRRGERRGKWRDESRRSRVGRRNRSRSKSVAGRVGDDEEDEDENENEDAEVGRKR